MNLSCELLMNWLPKMAILKSIGIHPDIFAFIKEPFATNGFFDLVPKSLIISKKKEISKKGRCLIEESPSKDGNT